MPQRLALLDTAILSELLKQHPLVTQRAWLYLADHDRLAFYLITRYEILRGFKAKQAQAQAVAFDAFCQVSVILPLTDRVIERAATCSQTPISSLRPRPSMPSVPW